MLTEGLNDAKRTDMLKTEYRPKTMFCVCVCVGGGGGEGVITCTKIS